MITPADIVIAARTIYGEARGESYEGKKAVAHVLINRTDHRRGDPDHTLAATALRHRQFSAWNEGDANREKLQEIDVDDPVFRDCMRAILEALDEPDPTKGSRHYMTVQRRARGWPGNWGEKKTPVARIGNHLFYNDVP